MEKTSYEFFISFILIMLKLVEQELPILPENLSSTPIFSGVLVTWSVVFCVVFCKSLFVLRFMASDYPFRIFKLFLWPLRTVGTCDWLSEVVLCQTSLNQPIRMWNNQKSVLTEINMFYFHFGGITARWWLNTTTESQPYMGSVWASCLERVELESPKSVPDCMLLWKNIVCYSVKRHFEQYFSYIVAVSFIDGGNRSTRKGPQTCHKSLTNSIR